MWMWSMVLKPFRNPACSGGCKLVSRQKFLQILCYLADLRTFRIQLKLLHVPHFAEVGMSYILLHTRRQTMVCKMRKKVPKVKKSKNLRYKCLQIFEISPIKKSLKKNILLGVRQCYRSLFIHTPFLRYFVCSKLYSSLLKYKT